MRFQEVEDLEIDSVKWDALHNDFKKIRNVIAKDKRESKEKYYFAYIL